MDSKRKLIRYLAGLDPDKTTEEVKIPLWRSESITTNHAKTYDNAFGAVFSLSKTARTVLDFIVQEMDDNNFVINNSELKEGLNSLIKKNKGKPYSCNTINKAFSELANAKVAYKRKNSRKGLYMVNPRFYFKGPEEKRIRLIRQIKESPFRDKNNQIRREAFLSEKK